MFANSQRSNSFAETAFGAAKGAKAVYWAMTKPRSVYDQSSTNNAPVW